jgi:hypothetical protein
VQVASSSYARVLRQVFVKFVDEWEGKTGDLAVFPLRFEPRRGIRFPLPLLLNVLLHMLL